MKVSAFGFRVRGLETIEGLGWDLRSLGHLTLLTI